MKIAVMFVVYGAESETAVGSPYHLRMHLQRIRQNTAGKVSGEQGKYKGVSCFRKTHQCETSLKVCHTSETNSQMRPRLLH